MVIFTVSILKNEILIKSLVLVLHRHLSKSLQDQEGKKQDDPVNPFPSLKQHYPVH